VEKKRFCCLGLFCASLLILGCFQVVAQAPSVEQSSRSVEVAFDVPIEGGDLKAARDRAQAIAFEKAMDASLPLEIPASVREQRIKIAPRFVKGFRLIEEKNAGDHLSFKYQVEFQGTAFEGLTVEMGPVVEAIDWHIEVVSEKPFNVGQLIERLEKEAGLKVTSFRLTRSALIVKVRSHKTRESLQFDIQGVVGSLGAVNVFDKLPEPAKPELNSPAPDSAGPSQGTLQPSQTGTNSIEMPTEHRRDELKKD